MWQLARQHARGGCAKPPEKRQVGFPRDELSPPPDLALGVLGGFTAARGGAQPPAGPVPQLWRHWFVGVMHRTMEGAEVEEEVVADEQAGEAEDTTMAAARGDWGLVRGSD